MNEPIYTELVLGIFRFGKNKNRLVQGVSTLRSSHKNAILMSSENIKKR